MSSEANNDNKNHSKYHDQEQENGLKPGGRTPPGVHEGGVHEGGVPVPEKISDRSIAKWRKDYRQVFGQVDNQFERRVQQARILLDQKRASSRHHALELIRNAEQTSSLPTPPGPMSPGAPNSQVPGTQTSSPGSGSQPGTPGKPASGVPGSQNRSESGGPGSPGSVDGVQGSGSGRGRLDGSRNFSHGSVQGTGSGGPGLDGEHERPQTSSSPGTPAGSGTPGNLDGSSKDSQGTGQYGPAERAANERTKWSEAYRSVFGAEPQGELAEERIRAAIRLYNPTRHVGRRQALEQVREGEEQTFFQAAMTERVVNKKDAVDGGLEGEPWLPLADESDLTLGAILLKMGRMEAELDYLQRFVVKLENQIHRTETRLGGMTPGLKSLRDSMKSIRDTVLQSSKRIDALLPSSGEGDGPITRKEIKEMRARIEEERGRMLLEVDNRLEETERMIQATLHTRIAVLESWAKRIGKYLGGRGGRN